MNGRDLSMALAGIALLVLVSWLATGCSLALSVTVARGEAETGSDPVSPCGYRESDAGVVQTICLPLTPRTKAASDHWNPEAIRELGAAAGSAAGAAAAEAAGIRALRPPTPVPAK